MVVMVVEEGIAASIGVICCNNGEYYGTYVEASEGKEMELKLIESNLV